jgi:hypothetical protein
MNFSGSNVITQNFLSWLAVLSLSTFIISLLLIPWAVGKLSSDYFLHITEDKTPLFSLNISSFALLVMRNILGFILLLAGIAMLFLPGQGILTILAGIFLLSFPGKRKIIRLFISRHSVQHSLDWIRIKRGRQPFLWP